MAAKRKQDRSSFVLFAAFFYHDALRVKLRFAWLWIFIFLPVPSAYAQTNYTESFSIATYYPAPYGVYRDLKIHRSTKYMPHSDVSVITDPKEGQVVYVNNSSAQGFYYYNGTVWQTLFGGGGGEGGMVITRSCPWGSDYRSGVNSGWGNQCNMATDNCCVPPDCPAGWTDIGKEAVLTKAGCRHWGESCYWNSTGTGHPAAIGRVVRYCVKE
ncbi:MAG: hypothetical protein PHT59_05550 [Candidatus Omnitrophica bacterium]|nr:hypothetical protein [Candidatus Omnitrophota bacterium]